MYKDKFWGEKNIEEKKIERRGKANRKKWRKKIEKIEEK